jgi:drug/metabolite transporter (DMT)-like permease
MWLCYYAALPEMSFALAAACYYTAPVWIALFARLSGAEKVDPRRWTGIGLALAGVVIAVDPWGTAVETVVVLPLGAAVFYAIAAVITGRRCADERALVMALNLNCVLAAGGAVGLAALALSGAARPGEFVAGLWPALSLGDWLLVLVLGLFLALIAIAVAEAYRAAPASIIGVFDNGYLLFAALWSVLLFDVLPSPWEAAGLGLIAAGAVLATLRARPPGPLRQAI